MIKTKTSKHRPQRRNRDQLQSSKHGTQETTNIWVKRKIRYQIAGKRASAKQPEAENVADTAVPSRLFSISALTTATTRRKAVAALCQTTCAQLLLILKASLRDGTLHGLSEHLALLCRSGRAPSRRARVTSSPMSVLPRNPMRPGAGSRCVRAPAPQPRAESSTGQTDSFQLCTARPAPLRPRTPRRTHLNVIWLLSRMVLTGLRLSAGRSRARRLARKPP